MEISLLKYLAILSGQSKPKFKSADLDSKVKDAYGILKECELCSHLCKVDRTNGETGTCNVPDRMYITSYFPHYGEEYFLVPSFTIFFECCTFECQFCQNWDISMRPKVTPSNVFTETELALIINAHDDCKNINFVGGEPTPYLPFILKTLQLVQTDLPVVWNSNFYMSEVSMELLRDVVDIYLSDFKYGNSNCALRLSKIPDYFEIVSRNHSQAFKDSELVIRHLVLPNHFKCCTIPILDFIKNNFGENVVVNLMNQYRPCFKANEYEEISQPLTSNEFHQAQEYAMKNNMNFIT